MRSSRTTPWLASLCVLLCLTLLPAGSSAQTTPTAPTAQKLFDFHSGLWINLHHFLYWQALSAAPRKGSRPLVLASADQQELRQLSPEEHAVWDAAVAYYAASLVQRDLLFDEGMETIKNQLEDAEASPDLATAAIPPDLKALLLKAAPIYKKHWWTRHDEQNRRWIAQLQPALAQYGSALSASLIRIYESPWPGDPVRVDAVAYANWAGAYTSLEPTRPAISTTDPANQGTAALEIVFHETSHGMMDKVMNGLHTAEKAVNASHSGEPVRFRRDLWHEVLFYTSGQLVADLVPGYVPYADKNGLWARAWPGPDRALLDQDWQPHMHGASPIAAALAKLVADLAAAPPRS